MTIFGNFCRYKTLARGLLQDFLEKLVLAIIDKVCENAKIYFLKAHSFYKQPRF